MSLSPKVMEISGRHQAVAFGTNGRAAVCLALSSLSLVWLSVFRLLILLTQPARHKAGGSSEPPPGGVISEFSATYRTSASVWRRVFCSDNSSVIGLGGHQLTSSDDVTQSGYRVHAEYERHDRVGIVVRFPFGCYDCTTAPSNNRSLK